MSLYQCHVFKQKLLKVGGCPDPEREKESESLKCSLSYVKDALILNFHFAHTERTTWHLYD